MMDDASIVALYWQRSEAALQHTADKYGRYCHAIALGILDSQPDAEECVTDTGLLGMEQPVAVSYAGDYNIYGERDRTYLAYEGSGDLGEQIVQYALCRTEFILDEEQALPGSTGGLWMLRRYDRLAAAELVGEYPLLLPEEARALLAAGYYTTGVPVDWPGEDCIEAVELTYRESGGLLMPFYRFWVRCDEAPRSEAEQALGLNTYGAFYVPAVRTEYWSALPEQEIADGGALRKGAQ